MKKCTKCGMVNDRKARFCKQCGNQLDGKKISSNALVIVIVVAICIGILTGGTVYLLSNKKEPRSSTSSEKTETDKDALLESDDSKKITDFSTEYYNNTESEIESGDDRFDDAAEPAKNESTESTFYPEDAVYNEENGHHYVLKNVSLNWDEAYEECVRQNGHLVTITSENEQKFVRKLIEEEGKKYHYWLGGSDADFEGDWRWVTGEEWDYTNWEENQPNNDLNYDEINGQDYLEIQATFGNNGSDEYMTWTDMPIDGVNPLYAEEPEYCSTPYYGYVCEWDE